MERQRTLARSGIVVLSAGILGVVGAMGHDIRSGQQAERIAFCLEGGPGTLSLTDTARNCLGEPSSLFGEPPGRRVRTIPEGPDAVGQLLQQQSQLRSDGSGLAPHDAIDPNTLGGIAGGSALAIGGIYLVDRISLSRRMRRNGIL